MTIVVSLYISLISMFVVGNPIGKVISNEPLEIGGVTAPSRNYVPVSLGENVSSGSAAVFVTFTNGSTAVLNPHSEIKIEGTSDHPDIRVIRGAAQYKPMPAASNVKSVSGVQPVIRRTPGAPAPAAYSAAVPVASAASATSSAKIAPTAPVITGGFLTAPVLEGTLIRNASSGGGVAIFTPTGLVINLTPVVNSTTGAVSYTVSSITQTVTQPNGVQTTVQVTTGSLIGASVGGITGSTTGGSTVAISFTPAGSTTPLTPSQASSAVQIGVQSAINTGVANGTLAAGTSSPSPSPVSTGTFSSTAP
jgi:hypothetical protein